jgi:hypothetical protein
MNNPQVQSALNKLKYMWLPKAKVGINRVLHDRECSRPRGGATYPYLSRFYDPKLKQVRSLPETVRFGGGKRGTITLSKQWIDFFFAENTGKAAKYLTQLQSGWVNYGPWPKVEQLCTASPQGTFVVVTKIDGNKAFIESYDNSKRPSDYENIDYLQRFGMVGSDDSIGEPDQGPAFTLAIHNPGEALWIDVRDITFVRSK